MSKHHDKYQRLITFKLKFKLMIFSPVLLIQFVNLQIINSSLILRRKVLENIVSSFHRIRTSHSQRAEQNRDQTIAK